MRPDLAPDHVARIKELAREGFYDGIVFHRVIDGFMAQTGDPTGTGTGGSGKKLKAEFTKEPHVRGTCSMARAQNPNSADSQFFICFDDAPLPRRAVHRLGRGDRRHGERRQDQARRAGERSRQDRQGDDGGRTYPSPERGGSTAEGGRGGVFLMLTPTGAMPKPMLRIGVLAVKERRPKAAYASPLQGEV